MNKTNSRSGCGKCSSSKTLKVDKEVKMATLIHHKRCPKQPVFREVIGDLLFLELSETQIPRFCH
jgi:hypothetical protein